MSEPIFFTSGAEWRDWLGENHHKAKECIIGFHKTHTKKPGISNKEAVDEALCFGWIDGVVNSIDKNTWKKRFTPRKPKSIWSAVNIKRIGELIEIGKVHPHGLKVFNERDIKRQKLYSFEQDEVKFSEEMEKVFRENSDAWDFFNLLPPSYRRPATWWVISAKQEETRLRRLDKLIEVSGNKKRLDHLISNKSKI